MDKTTLRIEIFEEFVIFFFRNIFSVTKLIDELLSDLVQLGNLISGQKLIETFQFSNNY